jgi:hypothetical protein
MTKITNDESERKYQNVYKVGGVKPVNKVIIKKKSWLQLQKKMIAREDCETTNLVNVCHFASCPSYLRFVSGNCRVVFHLYALYSLDNQCFRH